jgi:hypothetical protein
VRRRTPFVAGLVATRERDGRFKMLSYRNQF